MAATRFSSLSRRTRCTIAGVIGFALLAVTGGAIVWAMQGQNPPDGRMNGAEIAAYRAGDEVETALRWLERRASAASDELSRLIRSNSPQELLFDASQRLQQRLGLFEYQPGDAGEDWNRFDPTKSGERRSTVLLVHGLDEPGDLWDELAPALALEGHRVLRFNYANDQPPSASADDLAAALRRQTDAGGFDRVAIVAHSMGGLISRDVLTRHMTASDWAGPQVDRLITVGTPNAGSPVAMLQPIGEAREVVARVWASRSLDPSEVLSFVVDGSGDAAADLAAGSDYLTDLNSRSLPETTEITIIAARATASQREKIDEIASSAPVTGLLGEDARDLLLARIDAMTDQIGDGVVPVSSTPLEGIEDYQIVEANHRSALRTLPVLSTQPVPPAIPIILDRLRDRLESGTEPPEDSPNSPAGS